jgi:non-specific protein-tyrosine kinase
MRLSDYLSVLRRRKWNVVLATVLVAGTALLASLLETPVYQARARLLLQPSQSPFDATASQLGPGLVPTEIEVIQSEPVRAEVRKRIGVAPPVSAVQVGTTSVIEVRAQDPKPSRAAAITNAYAEAYIDYRRTEAVDALAAISQELQAKIDALQTDIDALASQLSAMPPCTGANPAPECSSRDSLQRDRDAKVALQAPFKQKLDELQVDASLKDGGATINSPAAPPTVPVRPRPVRNTALGFGTGLILGIGLAFLFEHLDDSIKTKEDVERLTPNLTILGLIPVISGWKKSDTMVVSETSPSSPAAEAYRTLRTSIGFAGIDRPMQVIQVTSPVASEGKTTTTANLAVALAKAGKRVIVLSADLRRPRIHEFFGVANGVGFTSVLLGEATLSQACQPVPSEPRIMVVASGPVPPNPSELLASPRTDKILDAIKARADAVVVDCPPVLPVTDAAVLAAKVDATLLLVTAESTTRKQLTRSLEILHQVGAPLIGTVLNGVSTDGAYGYAYYHYYGNGSSNGNGSGHKRSQRKARRDAKREG